MASDAELVEQFKDAVANSFYEEKKILAFFVQNPTKLNLVFVRVVPCLTFFTGTNQLFVVLYQQPEICFRTLLGRPRRKCKLCGQERNQYFESIPIVLATGINSKTH